MYGKIVILRMNYKHTETRLVHKGYFAVSVNAEFDADLQMEHLKKHSSFRQVTPKTIHLSTHVLLFSVI
jgi:hypothetical protein